MVGAGQRGGPGASRMPSAAMTRGAIPRCGGRAFRVDKTPPTQHAPYLPPEPAEVADLGGEKENTAPRASLLLLARPVYTDEV